MTTHALTAAQQKLADELGRLLARTPLDEELKQVILERLSALSSDELAVLVRWLSQRTRDADALVAALVGLQKKTEAEWKSVEREQRRDVEACIDDAVAAAEREAETEALLAGAGVAAAEEGE